MLDVINTFANIVVAVATIVTVVIAGKTLRESKKDQKEGLDRQKKQATLDAYSMLQKEVFDEFNQYTPSEIKEISLDTTAPDYKRLSGLLARIEHFCVGLECDIYDYETFYKMSKGYFYGERAILYNRLLPMLESKGLDANKDYFEYIHKVWKKIEIIEKERKE